MSTTVERATSPAPWHTDRKTVEMPGGEGEPARYGSYVWSSADDRLVAVCMGDTELEALANADLFIQVSKALATGEKAKAAALPLPGEKLRILVNEPNDAPLQPGEVVTVIADPDEGNSFVEGETVWVQDAGAGQWALDPATRGTDWVVIPRSTDEAPE